VSEMQNAALRAAALKALLDEVKKAYDSARDDADGRLAALNVQTGATTVEVRVPGYGKAVAQISLGEPKPGFLIDESGFLDYCKREHPTEVETVVPEPKESVRPAWRKALLARLDVDGNTVVDTVTGRVLEFIKVAEPGPASTALTWKPMGREQVVAAYRDGRLTLPDLLALPAAEQ
jgi:hypothetical protein